MIAMRRGLLLPLVAGLVLALLGVQLGLWQLRRADEKRDLQQRISARAEAPPRELAGSPPPEWQPVRVRGEWLPEAQVLLDNRVRAGRAGYHLVAPLRLADGRVVLVNRGWLPAAADRRQLPETRFASGPVELAGVLRRPEDRPFRLGPDEAGTPLRQHLALDEFAERFGERLLPYVIQQTTDSGDGLARDWPRPDAGIDRHRGYAAQWFGLAALAGGLTLYYGLRRGRSNDDA